MTMGGIYDPVDRSATGDLWPGALFVAVPMMLALRGLTVGVVVVGDKVISSGWLRVAVSEVEIPAVVGRPVKAQHLASQLRDALGLGSDSD
jgi:hypothetical protein